MKKLTFVLMILAIILSLSSCSDSVKIRTRALADRSIIILQEDEGITDLYEVGDTITIHKNTGSSIGWKIENEKRSKDESTYYDGFYVYRNKEKTDSTYLSGYTSIYLNVVIEKIIE